MEDSFVHIYTMASITCSEHGRLLSLSQGAVQDLSAGTTLETGFFSNATDKNLSCPRNANAIWCSWSGWLLRDLLELISAGNGIRLHGEERI